MDTNKRIDDPSRAFQRSVRGDVCAVRVMYWVVLCMVLCVLCCVVCGARWVV